MRPRISLPAITTALVIAGSLLQSCTSPTSSGRGASGKESMSVPRTERTPAGVPDGARIVFFGDSITRAGVEPGGYVSLVADSLRVLYPDRTIKVTGSGVAGDGVGKLIPRLRRDVLSQNPTVVVVYIGVNDVGVREPGTMLTPAEIRSYRDGLRTLLGRIRRAGARPFLCTPAVIGENVQDDTASNRALDEYAGISRAVAAQAGAGLCDLRSAFVKYLKRNNPGGRSRGILTTDGIHMNEAGNRFLARQMLKALGAPQVLVNAPGSAAGPVEGRSDVSPAAPPHTYPKAAR